MEKTTVPPKQPLTAAELMAHPAYKTINMPLQAQKWGYLDVAKGRGGPFSMYWELHGTGPIHIIWIMGLGASRIAWQRQTKDFGHTRGSQYSCLIFDNRGMGRSGVPMMRYSTSEMARDALELADHVGWTANRSLHVVGVSMGGMIAQELALAAPERVASLSLVSTAARIVNTTGFWENLANRASMFWPKPLDATLAYVTATLFGDAWLWQPDELAAAGDAPDAFPTNRDRVAAGEVDKRSRPDAGGFTATGFLLQAVAAGWHHKSADQLRRLADAVGRPRIQVLHGSRDRMISPPHADVLVAELGGAAAAAPDGIHAEYFDGIGHVLAIETRDRFRQEIEAHIARATAMDGKR